MASKRITLSWPRLQLPTFRQGRPFRCGAVAVPGLSELRGRQPQRLDATQERADRANHVTSITLSTDGPPRRVEDRAKSGIGTRRRPNPSEVVDGQ
jgi:hypothetical protein